MMMIVDSVDNVDKFLKNNYFILKKMSKNLE